MEQTSLIRKLIREAIGDLDKFHLTAEDMKGILQGYLKTALWTEEERFEEEYKENNPVDDEDDEEDKDEIDKIIQSKTKKEEFTGFSVDDIDPDSKIQAYTDIKKFMARAEIGRAHV